MLPAFLFALLIPSALAADKGINPNPDPNFDPATNAGTFGPFTPVRQAAPGATGGPGTVDPRTAQAMQLAMSNWMTDTGIVSGFQNIGKSVSDNGAFKGIADGAFKAEVDELTHKGVLDSVIGNDPRVSIANLTLTNGVFQSVVDNLQIMSIQGTARSNLVNQINSVRCTQILPSIDTYMIVAAQYIGSNAQQRRAVRPLACQQILANNAQNISAFPNVPGTPGGTPPGAGDGNVPGIPGLGQTGVGNLPGGNVSTAANNGTGSGSSANSAGSAANSGLPYPTTPQLGLPQFQNSPSGQTSAGGSASSGPGSTPGGSTSGSSSGGPPAIGTGPGGAGPLKKGKTDNTTPGKGNPGNANDAGASGTTATAATAATAGSTSTAGTTAPAGATGQPENAGTTGNGAGTDATGNNYGYECFGSGRYATGQRRSAKGEEIE